MITCKERVHYWKTHLCRVSGSLPSAESRALGKDTFCRVPKNSTRRTAGTRQNNSLPSAGHIALGKAALCRVLACGHSAKPIFAECLKKTLGKQHHVHRTRPHTTVTVGWPSRPLLFAKCRLGDTRQTLSRAPHTPVAMTVTLLPRTFPRYHDRYRYCLSSAS